jgi:SET domain-containing protein
LHANDANGLKKIKSLKNNSRYVTDKLRVYIEAMRDIAPGEEILVRYGKEYWDTIRYNMKLSVIDTSPALYQASSNQQ